MTVSLRRRLCALAALLLAAGLLRAPALAADAVVTNCASDADLRAKLTTVLGSGGGTLTFDCGPAPAAIVLTGGVLPAINQNVTVDGGGVITLSGNNASRLFEVSGGYTLTLRGLTLTRGHASGAGVNGDGGAVSALAGTTLIIEASRFLSNTAVNSGGAIVTYGRLVARSSEFAYNHAQNGGALYPRHGAVVSLTHSSLHHNAAAPVVQYSGNGLGGAVLVWDGPHIAIHASQIYSNTAVRGGGLYILPNSTLTVTNSTLHHNYGGTVLGDPGLAGGLYNAGTATLQATTLSANWGLDPGGAIHNTGGRLTLRAVTLSGNATAFGGAGLANYGGGHADLVNVTISGNKTFNTNGAGLMNFGASAALTNVTLSGNDAGDQGNGGGLWHNGTAVTHTLTLVNTAVAGNTLGGNCFQSNTSTTSMASTGFNLSDDATCSTFFTQPSDRNNEPASLLPLANYGGLTWTHMPEGDSLLLNNANGAACPAYDQRGVVRPQGVACDIGAVEFRPGVDPFGLFLPAILK